MKYEVTSDRAQGIDGLGVFAEGETRTFTEQEAEGFRRLQGVTLAGASAPSLPEGAKVTVVVGGEE